MGNNKDIGEAFRKKLERLDKSPSENLWAAIEKDLDTKSRRRLPLFWLFSAVGISSLVIGGLYFWNKSMNELPSNSKKTLENNNTVLKASNTHFTHHAIEKDSNNAIVNIEPKQSVLTQKETHNNASNGIDLNNNENPSIKDVENIQKSARSNHYINEQEKRTTTQSSEPIKNKIQSKTSIVSNSKGYETKTHTKNFYTYETTRLVKNSKRLVKSTEEYDEYEVVKKYSYIVKKKKTVEKRNVTLKKNKKNKQNRLNKVIRKKIDKPKLSKSSATKDNDTTASYQKKESENKNTTEINVKTDTITKPVTTKKATVSLPKKEIKKPIDSIQIEKKKKYIIFLSPYVGPSYYGSIGKGNSVATEYENDGKKGLIDLNYGIYVRWMFGDKIGLRTGIGKTNLSYATSIQKSGNNFLSTNHITLNSGLSTPTINNQFINDSEVTLTQKISYFEIPLEAYYTFIDKKIGVSTAFGLSYLILDNNTLLLKSNTIAEYNIGKATNLIDQSMSGNIKLILSYKALKSLQIDLSPALQYHFIGFKEVNNFRSYFASIQVGISYKL